MLFTSRNVKNAITLGCLEALGYPILVLGVRLTAGIKNASRSPPPSRKEESEMVHANYNILIFESGKAKKQPVDGYRASLPNFPEADVVINRTWIRGSGPSKDSWTCTEYESGLAIGEGRTREDAIANAESNIYRHGVERLLSSMSASIYLNGRAN